MTEGRAVEVLLSLQAHARLWDPDAHLLGTLRFGEVAEAITEVLVRRVSDLSGKRTDLLTLAQSVRPEALAGFLRDHGWTEQPARSPQICRFVLDGLTVLLPVTTTGADYAEAVLRAVQVVAEHEGYDVADVLVQVGDLAP